MTIDAIAFLTCDGIAKFQTSALKMRTIFQKHQVFIYYLSSFSWFLAAFIALFLGMPGDRYLINDQHNLYFITCTIIHWIDVFTRPVYKDIIVEAFKHCITYKGLRLYAWVIMTNHIHFIAHCESPYNMSDFLRDFKKYTSKKLTEAIINCHESRREWMLDKFSFAAKYSHRHKYYQVWTPDNHAILLIGIDPFQKLNYIHNNPVKAGIVFNSEDYIYSSAGDYCRKKGLIAIEHL